MTAFKALTRHNQQFYRNRPVTKHSLLYCKLEHAMRSLIPSSPNHSLSYSILFPIFAFAFLLFTILKVSPQVSSCTSKDTAAEQFSVWRHEAHLDVSTIPCPKDTLSFDGECIHRTEQLKVRYDPCNPRGKRVIRTEWKSFNNRAGIQSQTFGFLERHRFDCLIIPTLVRSILAYKLSLLTDVDYNSLNKKKVSYHAAPYLSPLRVLVFGPHGELGKMRTISELAHRTGKYPLDYIQADLSPEICEKYNAIPVNAMEMQFPDGFFSAVVLQHVLEHVADVNQTISEIYRVLAPNSFAILSAPLAMNIAKTVQDVNCTTSECRLQTFKQEDHVRILGRDLFGLLSSRFDHVRVGHYSQFYRSKMPHLRQLFTNPEYHHEDKSVYIYVFKKMNLEVIADAFVES